jgi:hypothetical protein
MKIESHSRSSGFLLLDALFTSLVVAASFLGIAFGEKEAFILLRSQDKSRKAAKFLREAAWGQQLSKGQLRAEVTETSVPGFAHLVCREIRAYDETGKFIGNLVLYEKR